MNIKYFRAKCYLIFSLISLFLFIYPMAAYAIPKFFHADRTHETKVVFDDMELMVPASAAIDEMTVDYDDQLDLHGFEKPAGVRIISKSYKFGPHGLKFRQENPLKGSFKINPALLPLGASLSDAKLYYINQETKKLELVEEQQVNSETGTLEAKLRHFSSYVVGVTAGWNSDGILPFYDYVHDGEEHVSVYMLNLSVVSPVLSIPGRNGFNLNLARVYNSDPSQGSTNIINPFIISTHWSWAFTYYDFVNHVLHFPDGSSYNIQVSASPPPGVQVGPGTIYNTYNTGSNVFTTMQNWGSSEITKIAFKDGSRIDISAGYLSYGETYTDIHGNQIKYTFAHPTVYYRDDHGNQQVYGSYYILSSILDSTGRNFQLNYTNDYTHWPLLQSIIQGSKTILSRTGSGNETFTDVANRSTSYQYNNYGISEIDYFNGVRSVYSWSPGPVVPAGYTPHPFITSQTLYRPDGTSRTVTYSIPPISNYYDYFHVTVTDGVRQKVYTLSNEINYTGLTLNETTKDLSGNTNQSINRDYYHYGYSIYRYDGYGGGNTAQYATRPHTISTQYMQANGSLSTPAVTEYNYDNWGNTTLVKDPNGTITYMTYANTDNNGSNINLSQINPAYQNALYQTGYPSNRYDMLLTKATLVNDPIHYTTQLNQTHYQYDSTGNMIKESNVYNGSTLDTTYNYDTYGNVISKTDPLWNKALFEYNTGLTGINDSTYLTKVSSQTNTGTTTILATYADFNDLGKPTTVTDPKGNVFKYDYDTVGRNTKQSVISSDPNVAVTKIITYDDTNSLVSIFYGNTTNGWQAGRVNYDPLFGKPIKMQRLPSLLNVATVNSTDLLAALGSNPAWQINKTITYDTDGRVVTENDRMSHTNSYNYDPLDRIIKTTYPDQTYSTANWDGLNATKYDSKGNRRDETYDLLNRLTTVKEYPVLNSWGNYYSTTYDYDTASHLVQTTNPKGAQTRNIYDNLGRLTQLDYPQNVIISETYTYDAAGNLKTKTTDKGTKMINYEFLGDYRIQQVTEADGRVVTYTYDNNSNLLTQSCPGTTYTYSNYDARNRAQNLTAQLDGNSFNFSYAYDTFGRMTAINYPNRTGSVTYQYDALDRLQTIPGFINSCSYDPDNKLTGMIYGNNVTTNWGYRTQDDKLSSIAIGTLLTLNYDYDLNGNITRINNDYYSYDGLNRLTWTGDNQTSGVGNETAWNYDSAGNMTEIQKRTLGAIQDDQIMSYDLTNRLLSKGNTGFSNDNAGARTAKTVGSDSWDYTYDGELRLNQVSKNSQVIEQNYYDGSGMRIKRVNGGTTTYYIYNGVNPLVEYTPVDGAYKYYIYTNNHAIAEEKSGQVTFNHHDHLGSVRLVTDASGNIVRNMNYSPYGETKPFFSDGFDGSVLRTDWTVNNPNGTQFTLNNGALQIAHTIINNSGDYIIKRFEKQSNAIIEFDAKIGSNNNDGCSLGLESEGLRLVFYGNNLYYYNSGWQLVGSVTFDQWNHYKLLLYQDKIEIWINNELKFSLAGSFGTKSYFAFRDYGLCFGPVINSIDNFSITPHYGEYEFTGKKIDQDTGLVYFGARFYDPETGRFISQDLYTNLPNDARILAGNKDSEKILQNGLRSPILQNRYIYCVDNPLNKVDPNGYEGEDAGGPYFELAVEAAKEALGPNLCDEICVNTNKIVDTAGNVISNAFTGAYDSLNIKISTQIHHWINQAALYGANSHGLLKHALSIGINIANAEWNKACMQSHLGGHTNEYYQFVRNALNQVLEAYDNSGRSWNKEELENALKSAADQVINALRNGEISLYNHN